jgi:cell division protein FtsL
MATAIAENQIETTEAQRQPETKERQPQKPRWQRFAIYQFFVDNILYLLLLLALAMLYIRNAHYSETLVRNIDQAHDKLREVRWEYMTVKAELISASKQTEIAKAVKSIGLKELSEPPKKIRIKAR